MNSAERRKSAETNFWRSALCDVRLNKALVSAGGCKHRAISLFWRSFLTSLIYCDLTRCLLSAGSLCLCLHVNCDKKNPTNNKQTNKKTTAFLRSAFNAAAQSCRANRWLNVNTSQTEGLTATPQVSWHLIGSVYTLCQPDILFCHLWNVSVCFQTISLFQPVLQGVLTDVKGQIFPLIA